MLFLSYYTKRVNKAQRRELRNIRGTIREAKTWYVDIPRTSSTSIKTEMADRFGSLYGKYYSREGEPCEAQKQIRDHTPSFEMQKLMGAREWEELYTFSFVRNPWDRYLSLYRFRLANNDLSESVSFETYVKCLEAPQYYNRESPYINKPYHMSMADYLTDGQGNVIVDDIFKFEDRSRAIATINRKLDLNIGQLHMEKTSTEATYRDAYTEEMKEIISRFYARDIALFGYHF